MTRKKMTLGTSQHQDVRCRPCVPRATAPPTEGLPGWNWSRQSADGGICGPGVKLRWTPAQAPQTSNKPKQREESATVNPSTGAGTWLQALGLGPSWQWQERPPAHVPSSVPVAPPGYGQSGS
ncbi:hypothetical protein H8959_018863 [Pygathrix nigripes]